MKYMSTESPALMHSFREAVINGIAPDGSLYMPKDIPVLDEAFFKGIDILPFTELAHRVLYPYCAAEFTEAEFADLLAETFTFSAPLKKLSGKDMVLELFHGPTLAFKDFGARFMARILRRFAEEKGEEYTILVATSGDTGSAVASAFLGQPGIKVVLLYPSGMVSEIQEKQLTTQGGNVQAVEVQGNFDHCQAFVKRAFHDQELLGEHNFSSANSINIARLLPQMLYYFSAYAQLPDRSAAPLFSVPSGNLGNLSAGLIASRMGLPVARIIAALNANRTFYDYLESGVYRPAPTIATFSNAMDVGDPSNVRRIFSLFNDDHDEIVKVIFSRHYNDDETTEAIRDIYKESSYTMDPHGAVGWLALREYRMISGSEFPGIVLETAHHAKFKTTVDKALSLDTELPPALRDCMKREKDAAVIPADYQAFKDYLLAH